MVVQHNLTAMNSNRMLGLTTASQAKSTEKLSSGYKINRAADDAVLPTFPVVSPFSRYVSLNLVVSDTRSISVTN